MMQLPRLEVDDLGSGTRVHGGEVVGHASLHIWHREGVAAGAAITPPPDAVAHLHDVLVELSGRAGPSQFVKTLCQKRRQGRLHEHLPIRLLLQVRDPLGDRRRKLLVARRATRHVYARLTVAAEDLHLRLAASAAIAPRRAVMGGRGISESTGHRVAKSAVALGALIGKFGRLA